MAEENAYEARMRREAIADDALTAMLTGLKAFFEGRATLHIGQMEPGVGQPVRFKLDADGASQK